MANSKTGVNTSTIINTRDTTHYAIEKNKEREKQKRAKVCLGCKYNSEGYCKKHSGWCSRVNYICNGSKDPYEYKMPKSKKSRVKGKKKAK